MILLCLGVEDLLEKTFEGNLKREGIVDIEGVEEFVFGGDELHVVNKKVFSHLISNFRDQFLLDKTVMIFVEIGLLILEFVDILN